MFKKLKRKIKNNKTIYSFIKNIYCFIFFNKTIGKILWLSAYYLHSSKTFIYSPCLCKNTRYAIYLNYGKHKVLSCLKCNLMRNFPMPKTGIYEKEMSVAYENNPDISIQVKEVFIHIKKYFSTDINILDFGCGDGRSMSFSKELGFKNVYGLEISNHLMEKAKKYGYTIFNDKKQIPLNLRFDVVISDNVFEHISNLDEILDDIKKIMTDDGVLIACVPNVRARCMYNSYVDLLWDTHYWQFNPETFSEIFKKNGFNVLDCQTITEKPSKILKISSPNINGDENNLVFIIAKIK